MSSISASVLESAKEISMLLQDQKVYVHVKGIKAWGSQNWALALGGMSPPYIHAAML